MGKEKKIRSLPSKKGEHFQVQDTELPPDYDEFQPLFSLKYMPYQSPCCISRCQKKQRSNILQKNPKT